MKLFFAIFFVIILNACIKPIEPLTNNVKYQYFGNDIKFLISENGGHFEKVQNEFKTNDKSIYVNCSVGKLKLYCNDRIIIDTLIQSNLNNFRLDL